MELHWRLHGWPVRVIAQMSDGVSVSVNHFIYPLKKQRICFPTSKYVPKTLLIIGIAPLLEAQPLQIHRETGHSEVR